MGSMIRRPSRRFPTAALLALLVSAAFGLAAPRAAHAQLRAPLGASSGGWAPIGIGVRVGRDSALHDNVVGGQLRIPVLPDGSLELMPNMDVTFARGSKAYQYNLELVYIVGGRLGGLYGGGGIGFRKARFGAEPTDPRETSRGYTGVVGLKISGLGRVVPQIEWRWVWVDKAGINPQQVMLGVTVALWG